MGYTKYTIGKYYKDSDNQFYIKVIDTKVNLDCDYLIPRKFSFGTNKCDCIEFRDGKAFIEKGRLSILSWIDVEITKEEYLKKYKEAQELIAQGKRLC